MNTFKRFTSVVAFSVFSLAGVNAQADTFQGTVWSITGSQTPLFDLNPSTETYRVNLTVDTSGYTGSGSFLDQVAIKVSNSLVSASLFNAPGTILSWSLVAGGLSANGCNGSGSGFECANSTFLLNLGRGVAVGGTYIWGFDLTMNNGALFSNFDGASVKGRFVDQLGNKVGDLVSETLTAAAPVPEPEIYAMMAAGLGMLGFMSRRKKKNLSAVPA